MSTVNTTYLMPLTNTPQSFVINVAGTDLLVTCKWNSSPDAGWVLDIMNNDSSIMIAANIPLITGMDMLNGLEYLNLGGSLVCYTDGGDFSVPTIDNLGDSSNVYFVTSSTSG